jgi:hypothetical protein
MLNIPSHPHFRFTCNNTSCPSISSRWTKTDLEFEIAQSHASEWQHNSNAFSRLIWHCRSETETHVYGFRWGWEVRPSVGMCDDRSFQYCWQLQVHFPGYTPDSTPLAINYMFTRLSNPLIIRLRCYDNLFPLVVIEGLRIDLVIFWNCIDQVRKWPRRYLATQTYIMRE